MSDFSLGDAVGDTAIDASGSASDTNSAQPEPKANVWATIAENAAAGSTAETDAADLESALENEPDDQIPGEEAGDETDETAGDAADKDGKKPRSQNFKELQTAKEKLEADLIERDTEITAAKTQLATLDTALEAYGGVEQIGALIENQNKWIDPALYKEAVDSIAGLPQKDAIYGEILNRSFNIGDVTLDAPGEAKALANRVQVVNGALRKDFGLTNNLTEAELSKTFEWLAVRANNDTAELLNDLNDELELLTPKTSAVDKVTQARIDALEKQVAEQKKADAPVEEPLSDAKAIALLKDYTDDVIGTVSAVILKDYHTTLEKLEKTAPYKAKAIIAVVNQHLNSSEIYGSLAHYLLDGKKDHPNAVFLAGQNKNSIKTLIRSAAAEFLGKPPAAAPPKSPSPSPSTRITGTGKATIAPQPKSAEGKNPWGGYYR